MAPCRVHADQEADDEEAEPDFEDEAAAEDYRQRKVRRAVQPICVRHLEWSSRAIRNPGILAVETRLCYCLPSQADLTMFENYNACNQGTTCLSFACLLQSGLPRCQLPTCPSSAQDEVA